MSKNIESTVECESTKASSPASSDQIRAEAKRESQKRASPLVVCIALVGRFFSSVAYIFKSQPGSPWYEPLFGLLILFVGLAAISRIIWRLANW